MLKTQPKLRAHSNTAEPTCLGCPRTVHRRSTRKTHCSEFESVVVVAVACGGVVAVSAVVAGEGVVGGGELVAAGQQVGDVGVDVSVGDRRQVGGGVVDGGQRGAVCGVGGAQVLSPGQVGGGDGGQGVGGGAARAPGW